MMDEEYWEHVRRCDENGATANNMPNDAIISVLHAALIVYITECREVDDADGEMYARQAQQWLDSQRQGQEVNE